MSKRKAGLHKEVSSIFRDMPGSPDDGASETRHVPVLAPAEYRPSEPKPPEQAVCVETEPVVPSGKPQSGQEQPRTLPQEHEAAEPEPSQRPAIPEPEAQPDETQSTFSHREHEPRLTSGRPPRTEPSDQPDYSRPEPQPDQKRVHPSPKAAPSKQPKVTVTTKVIGLGPLGRLKNKLLAPKPGVNQKRQKVMVLLVPLLAIILIVVYVKVVIPPSSTLAKQEQGKNATSVKDSDDEIDWEIPPPYPATLHDPMQSVPRFVARAAPVTPETGEQQAEAIIISSILHSSDKPSAAIGDRILHEGDTVAGATIIKISKDSVEFERNGKKWTQKVRRQENGIP
jgi:hypothetical protein